MYTNTKYRFKTIPEFEREFGDEWRLKTTFNREGHMDYLLGADVKHPIKINDDGVVMSFEIHDRELGYNWYISHQMIKSIHPSYDRKIFIYE